MTLWDVQIHHQRIPMIARYPANDTMQFVVILVGWILFRRSRCVPRGAEEGQRNEDAEAQEDC
jgi:hypothetical protein